MGFGGGQTEIFSARYGPRQPRFAQWASRAASSFFRGMLSRRGLHPLDSRVGRERLQGLSEAIDAGREAYVLGIGTWFHNSGAALVRVSANGQVELVCNEEEERYTAVKHCSDYPRHAVEAVIARMRELGIEPSDLAACVGTWDYATALVTFIVRPVCEELPSSLAMLRHRPSADLVSRDGGALADASKRLGDQLGLGRGAQIVTMRHHDCHAYFSYAVSPFAGSPEPTMTIVLDGSGDDASMSLYECREGRLELLGAYGTNVFDSLGTMYGVLSSSLGGWSMLSSEGRYMGAAAWGDGDRMTNRYYRRLKHLLHFGEQGEVQLNRELARWMRSGMTKPFGEELIDVVGEPITLEDMWNPDRVLNVEEVRHPEITRDRVDKAAAVQMIFEDALAHTVDHLIRATGSHRLVLTGGTALNCVANMRLLERFDEAWYERNLGLSDTTLRLWVPPTPGDAGTPAGAAYAFAMQAGARPGPPLRHAFYCGRPALAPAIEQAVEAEPAATLLALGDCSREDERRRVADLLAHLISGDLIVGLYQGSSETGPRALGHRSILANPRNPETRRLLNERVKHRELIRPLAPMLTRAAAEHYFELMPGASDDDYNAYNYMILTARARPHAVHEIPAVIHQDGTGRLQIVRPDTDPFCHDYLLAMGRRTGAEASVNTSLNVGAPIAHTPAQAIETLGRARGMDALLMIDAEQQARLVWLSDREDAARRLTESLDTWARETGAADVLAAL